MDPSTPTSLLVGSRDQVAGRTDESRVSDVAPSVEGVDVSGPPLLLLR